MDIVKFALHYSNDHIKSDKIPQFHNPSKERNTAMNFKTIIAMCIAAAVSCASVYAAGPGGSSGGPGGNSGGPGGNSGGSSGGPSGEQGGGGMGGGGSLTYDSVISVTTNANCLVREGILFGSTSSLSTSVAPTLTTITALADGVFAGNTAITSVDLSNTAISELPADAFAGCTSLQTVVLPLYCTAIGANAFAGCPALSSLTAAAVTTVGADAFRGCTSLTAVPAAVTEIGDYAFTASGVASADVSGVTALGEGAFAGCTKLKSVTLPANATLPDAVFAGCTSLDAGDWSGVATFGQAALAGIPATTLTLGSNAVIGDYAFAANKATVETTISIDLPDGYETTFLGRHVSYTHNGDVIVEDAHELVQWLEKCGDAVTQPASYATASLETWLATSSNADAVFAFCYGDYADVSAALTIDGTAFTFTATARSSVKVTLIATYDLAEDFSDRKVALAETDIAGVYAATAADPAASACFMRLKFAKAW